MAGVEYLLTESSRISLEGFAKLYDHYPVSIVDNVSLANKGGGFEVLGNEPVRFDGRGRTRGMELLYQQKFNGKFYAIAALTFYRSEFTNGDGVYVPSTWDNGQLVSLTGGYKFGRNWEVSTRFRFLGRAPYAPVDQEATLANYPAIIRDYSRLGETRTASFQQLDFRVDKKWNFRRVTLDLYLDVQNFYGSKSAGMPQYTFKRNYDNTAFISTDGNPVNVNGSNAIPFILENRDGNVLPTIGFIVEF